jgi:AcrR family transcriptional regulator
VQVVDRPLRKDAERNRERILQAARELFAQRGLGVTLNDVAHHAGVGVGTVYRRFPERAALLEALFDQQIDRVASIAEGAVADADPWRGLAGFLEQAAELQAADRGFWQLMLGAPEAPERVRRMRERMIPLATEMMQRAHASGQLREGIAPADIPMIQLMLGTVIDSARGVEPELWRRYLAILLEGLRAEPDPHQALPVPPLATDKLPDVMASWQPPRR